MSQFIETIYGNPALPTDSPKLPIRKIMVQALAFTGLSTISLREMQNADMLPKARRCGLRSI